MRGKIGIIAASLLITTAFGAHAQTVSYTYDDLGRVQTVTPSSGAATTTYSYDSADNRTAVTTAVPSANHAPVCTNRTVNMTIPTNVGPVTTTFTASTFTASCTDADGDTITVTSPATPMSLTISAHQSINYPFTVSDGRGGTASAILTAVRP